VEWRLKENYPGGVSFWGRGEFVSASKGGNSIEIKKGRKSLKSRLKEGKTISWFVTQKKVRSLPKEKTKRFRLRERKKNWTCDREKEGGEDPSKFRWKKKE